MKLVITACFLFLGLVSLNAQERKVYIDKFQINDQVIHGSIDDKYPITMYLEFGHYYDDGMSHSVSGWYYYDQVKKKIPLTGIWSGIFTLYQFADQKQSDSIMNLISLAFDTLQSVDDLIDPSAYLEKFEFTYEKYMYKGTWENNIKKLNVTFDTDNIDLTALNELLVLQYSNQNKKHIALKQFGPYYSGYSIFADKIDATGCKVLLQYEVMSRSNPNGMCGAGQEIGYLLLTFDSKGTLLDYRTEAVESCLRDFWSEMKEVPGTNGQKLIYKVTYQDEKVRTVTVDGVNFTLSSKE